MFQRRSQPPVNPTLRATEHHNFFPGFIAAFIGLVLVVGGARHITAVDTVDGDSAWETQLVKAFSNGGLRFPSHTPAPPPAPNPHDPLAGAEALERWAKQAAKTEPPKWKVRIDASAKTPCPT